MGLFGRIDRFFLEIELQFSSKFIKLQICCRMRIKWFYFSTMSSALLMRFLWQKMSGNFERWENKKTMVKKVLFRVEKWESSIYAVVAGRRVFVPIKRVLCEMNAKGVQTFGFSILWLKLPNDTIVAKAGGVLHY